MLYYTRSSKSLAEKITLPMGSFTIKQFSDGEWHVTVHDTVRNRKVWVLTETGPPADNIIQLLLLCDALKRAGASINLLVSYFGYARQDHALTGEALASEVLCHILRQCAPEQIAVLHVHNPAIFHKDAGLSLRSFFGRSLFSNHIPYQFFYACTQDADLIVAPDKGARPLAQTLAEHAGKELVLLEKHRLEPEALNLRFLRDYRITNKNALIVDDMISTGGTLLRAAHLLHEQGAQSIRVAATHGIFAGDALEKFDKSVITKVQVTNSLEQKQLSEKLSVTDISSFIKLRMS